MNTAAVQLPKETHELKMPTTLHNLFAATKSIAALFKAKPRTASPRVEKQDIQIPAGYTVEFRNGKISGGTRESDGEKLTPEDMASIIAGEKTNTQAGPQAQQTPPPAAEDNNPQGDMLILDEADTVNTEDAAPAEATPDSADNMPAQPLIVPSPIHAQEQIKTKEIISIPSSKTTDYKATYDKNGKLSYRNAKGHFVSKDERTKIEAHLKHIGIHVPRSGHEINLPSYTDYRVTYTNGEPTSYLSADGKFLKKHELEMVTAYVGMQNAIQANKKPPATVEVIDEDHYGAMFSRGNNTDLADQMARARQARQKGALGTIFKSVGGFFSRPKNLGIAAGFTALASGVIVTGFAMLSSHFAPVDNQNVEPELGNQAVATATIQAPAPVTSLEEMATTLSSSAATAMQAPATSPAEPIATETVTTTPSIETPTAAEQTIATAAPETTAIPSTIADIQGYDDLRTWEKRNLAYSYYQHGHIEIAKTITLDAGMWTGPGTAELAQEWGLAPSAPAATPDIAAPTSTQVIEAPSVATNTATFDQYRATFASLDTVTTDMSKDDIRAMVLQELTNSSTIYPNMSQDMADQLYQTRTAEIQAHITALQAVSTEITQQTTLGPKIAPPLPAAIEVASLPIHGTTNTGFNDAAYAAAETSLPIIEPITIIGGAELDANGKPTEIDVKFAQYQYRVSPSDGFEVTRHLADGSTETEVIKQGSGQEMRGRQFVERYVRPFLEGRDLPSDAIVETMPTDDIRLAENGRTGGGVLSLAPPS